jgi:hypothetical protein
MGGMQAVVHPSIPLATMEHFLAPGVTNTDVGALLAPACFGIPLDSSGTVASRLHRHASLSGAVGGAEGLNIIAAVFAVLLACCLTARCLTARVLIFYCLLLARCLGGLEGVAALRSPVFVSCVIGYSGFNLPHASRTCHLRSLRIDATHYQRRPGHPSVYLYRYQSACLAAPHCTPSRFAVWRRWQAPQEAAMLSYR